MTAAAIILAIILLILQAGDIWTTNRVIALGGREVNPVVRWIMDHLGRWWPASKLPLVGPVFVAAWAWPGAWQVVAMLAALTALYGYVVWQNWRAARRMEEGWP